MTEENATAEMKYRLAKGVFKTLYENGTITASELDELLAAAVKKYHPIIGELEINSIARENGYDGR